MGISDVSFYVGRIQKFFLTVIAWICGSARKVGKRASINSENNSSSEGRLDVDDIDFLPASRLFCLVNRYDVTSEIGGEGEVLVALIALIFALVMDGHHVSFQIGGKTERLATQVTLVDGPHFFRRLQRHVAGSQGTAG